MIKKTLRYSIHATIVLFSFLLSRLYKLKNYRRKKILIYADSRGFEISKISNRRNPFSSYIGFFIKNYNVDFQISPRKHTTTLDFLEWYRKVSRRQKYAHIILHTGIVDFSPRPRSMVKEIFKKKRKLYEKTFEKTQTENHLLSYYETQYENEVTNNLYSLEMADQGLLPRLNQIEGLIWISCNRVLSHWEGNYPRKRPGNMNVIDEYNRLFLKSLKRTIDISDWTDDEIVKYTCDNIHLTKLGMQYIKNRLLEYCE